MASDLHLTLFPLPGYEIVMNSCRPRDIFQKIKIIQVASLFSLTVINGVDGANDEGNYGPPTSSHRHLTQYPTEHFSCFKFARKKFMKLNL